MSPSSYSATRKDFFLNEIFFLTCRTSCFPWCEIFVCRFTYFFRGAHLFSTVIYSSCVVLSSVIVQVFSLLHPMFLL